VKVRVVSQGVMVLREEDPHVPATAAVYLASLVVRHATVRVREKVKARYVKILVTVAHSDIFCNKISQHVLMRASDLYNCLTFRHRASYI
jgi:hypothetical protein